MLNVQPTASAHSEAGSAAPNRDPVDDANALNTSQVKANIPLLTDPATWASLPVTENGYGYLYVVEFSTDVVKVGKTANPAKRMATYLRDAQAMRIDVTNVWVSDAHADCAGSEAAALIAVDRQYPHKRIRLEYFKEVDFDQVVTLVAETCGSVVDSVGEVPVRASTTRVPAWRAVADDLTTRISAGEFVSDAWLPSIPALAATYNVGPTVIRQTLQALRQQGLISVHQGKGSQVVQQDAGDESSADLTNEQAAELMARVRNALVDTQGVVDQMAVVIARLEERAALNEPQRTSGWPNRGSRRHRVTSHRRRIR